MVHHSCDLCGKKIEEQRFVVQLEVYPALTPDDVSAEDEDRDNLTELSDILSNLDETGELELNANAAKSFRYDLCQECQREFRKDPLARHRRRFRFSEN